jgi:hypothetical protein
VKAPALAALAPEEPASRSAGKLDPVGSHQQEPPAQAGGFANAENHRGGAKLLL